MKPANKVVSGSDALSLACMCGENTTCFTPPLIESVGCLWALRAQKSSKEGDALHAALVEGR